MNIFNRIRRDSARPSSPLAPSKTPQKPLLGLGTECEDSPVSIFDLCNAVDNCSDMSDSPTFRTKRNISFDCTPPHTPPARTTPIAIPPTPVARRLVHFRSDSSSGSSTKSPYLEKVNSLMESKVLLTTRLQRKDSDFKFGDHFEFLETLGKGSFSEVFMVRHMGNGSLFAVKKSTRQFRGKKDREIYVREVQSIASLEEHPNIVKSYRCWQDSGHFWIQMELCSEGSIRSFHQKLGRAFSEGELWQALHHLASGLAFIHENSILHLDVKPENVFIKDGSLKLGDFGLAVVDSAWESGEGDCAYMAPEMLQHGYSASWPADIFSLGVSMYEWMHPPPYKAPCNGETWQALRQGMVINSSEYSLKLRELVQLLLSPDPSSRPTAADVRDRAAAELNALMEISMDPNMVCEP
eukprot:Rmarinus@m.10674